MQILKFVLYSRSGETRELTLRPGAVNVITGASKSGKTALIEIARYCLGSTECHVPEGVIRNAVAWYGLLLQFPDMQAFVARSDPGPGAKSSSEIFLATATTIEIPAMASLRGTTNPKSLQDYLTSRIGIGENLHVPPEGQTRRPLEVNLSHAQFFNFQRQDEVANPRFLFHRQGEPFLEAYLSRAALGAMPLSSVTSTELRAFVAWLLAQPSKRGGTLAPRTVRNAFDVVRRMLAWASSEDVRLIERSPCTDTPSNLPAIADKNREFRANAIFSRTEALALVTDERIPEDRRVLYALLLLTGCRVGEIAALRWGDFEEHATPLARLTIAHSHQSSTRKIKGTKTGAIRLVPVHPTLRTVLLAWREHQQPKGPESWIIPNKDGMPRASSGTHKQVTADLKRLGIKPRGMQQHAMRHTLISLARADGARGDLLKWVTHTPPRAQLDQYTTPSWESLCTEVAKLNLDLDNASNSASRKDERPGTL